MISTIFAIITAVMAAVSGIGSIISQNKTNKLNKELNEENREDLQSFSVQQAEQANQETRSLYNELYSPAAKVSQLKNAGLSVGMMYGTGGTGGSSSTSAAQAATPSNAAPIMNPSIDKNWMNSLLGNMGNIANVKKEESVTELNLTNKEKVNKEIKLIEQQTNTQILTQNGIELDNKLKEIDLQFKEPTMQAQLEKTKQETEAIESNMRKTLKEIDLLEIDEKYKSELYYVQLKKTAQEILESKSRQMLNLSEIALTEAKTDKERAEIEKVVNETTKLIEETKITTMQVDMTKIERAFKAAKEQIEITNKMGAGNMLTGTLKFIGESVGQLIDELKGKHDYKNY